MTSRFQRNIVGCFGGVVNDDHGGAYPSNYLLKAKRSPRSETFCSPLSNVKLLRSGVRAAESNTINENRTKTLAKSIVKLSFIKPPREHEKAESLRRCLSS